MSRWSWCDPVDPVHIEIGWSWCDRPVTKEEIPDYLQDGPHDL
jgi:hypothetical protein